MEGGVNLGLRMSSGIESGPSGCDAPQRPRTIGNARLALRNHHDNAMTTWKSERALNSAP